MGFTPQSTLWHCGPFALKHALTMLGIFADEKEISKVAGTNKWYGTDEVQLDRAARKFGCDLRLVRKHDPDHARRQLVSYLRRASPCLICTNQWSHWVTVVKAEKDRFILLDSRNARVLTILPWNRFKNFWVYRQQDKRKKEIVDTLYDFHPVVPRARVQTRAKFSLARAEYLRRPENRDIALQWDEYVEDLLAICKPRTALSSKVISLGEFLRRHGGMILDQVGFWHGWIDRPRAQKILKNMHFVAGTYGLVIHEGDEKRAIAGITALLTLWAGGRYGIGPVYQAKTTKKKKKAG